MGGSESFFGGLLGGVSEGLLRREMMQYQIGMKNAESRRRAVEKLLESGDLYPEEVAPAIKALLAPTLMSPSIAERFAGGVKRAITGKKKASQESGPMDQFFSSFESMRRPEGQQAVPHGPATAPLQTEAVGAPANVPAITPVPQPRSKTMREIWAGQESQAKLGEFQGQTDIQTRAGEERKRLESERLQREGEAMGLKGRDLAEYKAGRNIFGGMQGRFVSKALGSTLPQNALGLDGVVIPAELRTQEHIFSGVPVGVNDAGDPQYQWVETVPGQGESPSTDIKNYQFAVSQGYKGTFEQWQKDEATRRPRSESTVVIETVDADGNPVRRVVPKTAGAEYPAALTGPTKTMREAAPKVVGFIKRIRPQLDSAKLGPVAGRWNELWTGKIGTADPEFMRLRTNVGLLSTLLLRMHVGARGGQILLEHFKNLMDSGKQSPENMRAALDEIEAYANDLLGQGEGGTLPEPPKPRSGNAGAGGAAIKTADDLKAKYGIK